MSKRPQLMIMTGPGTGTRYDVPDGGLRLGRSSANDVHVPDEELSRNHCLFEPDGTDAIRVIDLASANGTFVNSQQLGGDARTLRLGDIVEAGTTVFKIVDADAPAPVAPPPALAGATAGETGAAPAAGAVDLGLGGDVKGSDLVAAGAAAGDGAKGRAPLANILWGVVALAVALAIALVLLVPDAEPPKPTATAASAKAPPVSEVYYEKVEADATRIFRYQMTVGADGTLRVVYDDVPGENRHVDKSAKLDARARARIAEIFESDGWDALDDAYTGARAADENALKSWRIRTVRGTRVKDTLVENTPEPAAFQSVREALETFSRNELGVWALQYSKEQLAELSARSEAVGDARWEERDVEHGNTAAALAAYREALFYLETVNPKPPTHAALREKAARATAELDRRYREQRFLADKALNLADWEAARTELRILLDLVPDKDDARHAEANAKLVDVENRLRKNRGAKKGAKK